MTVNEYRRLSGHPPSSRSKKNKYQACKTGRYDSRKEASRAARLKIMLRAGLISNLREQVSFELIPSQFIDGSCVERSCRYIADFVYNDKEGNLIVEDTKGIRTKDYIIKRKLMLFRHGIRIKET